MRIPTAVLLFLLLAQPLLAQTGLIAAFPVQDHDVQLTRLAQPHQYFDKVGHRFALLGTESGGFEAWAWPVKLFRDFRFDFFIGSSTVPLRAEDLVHRITVRPEATTITWVFQSFTVQAHYLTPVDEAGALILLAVDSTEPLKIVCSFVPMLMPMWPAGLGGQYAWWDETLKAYLISESSRQQHGYVGSPAASGLSYTPAHMLSDQPNQFQIEVLDPSAVRGRFIPIVMAGGKGDRAAVRSTYERLVADPAAFYRSNHAYFQDLRARSLRITTPVPALNEAFEWAKVSYDNLRVVNPDFTGTGLVAGWAISGRGGRPGFGWFFGGDTYINSFSLNALGLSDYAREGIAFLNPFQRSDGKMPHEISQSIGYLDWFGKYPYAYLHGDTSPFYLVALHDYYRATGDTAFVRANAETLRRAWAWCRTTDGDGDGLMDNEKAGLGALEFGALTGIRTDSYLAAVWIRATEAIQMLAAVLGDPALAAEARQAADRGRQAFEQFWNDETGMYAYAFNAEGHTVNEVTPWSSVGMMWGYGQPDRVARTLERLSSSELTTDWGTRMLSDQSTYFEPLNYNYGAVWPFLTSWTATAQLRNGFALQGYAALRNTAGHIRTRGLGFVTEVYSGHQHTWPAESVPHQGFCTAATVLPLVRGLLGLDPDVPARQLTFAPRLPGDWEHLTIEHVAMGAARLRLDYRRTRTGLTLTITGADQPLTLHFAPLLAGAGPVRSVRANGRAVPFQTHATGQGTALKVETPLTGRTVIDVAFTPDVALLPPAWPTQPGAPDQGLKVVSIARDRQQRRVVVEGRAGQTYRLPLLNADLLTALDGAERDGADLVIRFAEVPGNPFVRQTLTLHTR
jgi:glycogen debranching enzyme